MQTDNHKTEGVAPVGSSAVLGDSGGVIPINALSGVYDWLRHQKEMNERNHIFHPDFLDGNIRNIKELLDRARQLQAGIVPVKNADTGSLGVTAGKTSIYETLRRAVHRRFDGLLECLLLWCHKFRGVESPNVPKLSHDAGNPAPAETSASEAAKTVQTAKTGGIGSSAVLGHMDRLRYLPPNYDESEAHSFMTLLDGTNDEKAINHLLNTFRETYRLLFPNQIVVLDISFAPALERKSKAEARRGTKTV